MKVPSNSVKTALFLGNALPRARGLYRSVRTDVAKWNAIDLVEFSYISLNS